MAGNRTNTTKTKSGNNTRKKSTSGTKSSTSSRSNTGKGKGRDDSDNRLMHIFCVLLLITVLVLVLLYFRNCRHEDSSVAEPTPTATITPSAAEPTQEPTPTPVAEVTPTPVPEATVAPTEEPTEPEEGEEIGESLVSLEQADAIIAEAITEEGYSVELSDDHLYVEDGYYYCYVILYQGHTEEYTVLVNQQNGALYYYDVNGNKSDFEGVIPHPDTSQSEEISVERAAELLADLDYAQCNLPAPLADCTLSLDEWQTVVFGNQCYCLNVFYNGSLAGSIYFTESAEYIYYLDEFGEFVRVR